METTTRRDHDETVHWCRCPVYQRCECGDETPVRPTTLTRDGWVAEERDGYQRVMGSRA